MAPQLIGLRRSVDVDDPGVFAVVHGFVVGDFLKLGGNVRHAIHLFADQAGRLSEWNSVLD